jgi:hypothetical protein
VLNSSEPTLTRVDVHPISSYNIFLDGVLVVDGSCTHEPKDKDRNPWESMKPVTMHPIVFVSGWGDFFNFCVPNVFHMVSTTHSIKFGIVIYYVPNLFLKFPMYFP